MSAYDCAGKRRYSSFGEAERTAKYRHGKIDEILHAYSCRQCGGFHLGTVNDTQRQKARDRRRRKMAVKD